MPQLAVSLSVRNNYPKLSSRGCGGRDFAILALEEVGRDAEIIPICEREAKVDSVLYSAKEQHTRSCATIVTHAVPRESNDDDAVTVITVEEQIRGRLEIIRRHGASPLQVAAYTAFQQTLRYFATWQVRDLTQAAFEQFSALREQRIRVGPQDLRIAAITLANNAILVTRNTRDFAQVSGLVIEDCSAT